MSQVGVMNSPIFLFKLCYTEWSLSGVLMFVAFAKRHDLREVFIDDCMPECLIHFFFAFLPIFRGDESLEYRPDREWKGL
jgi:hypothetical protein